MPKGLTNAPTAFQRFMNDIFMDMIDINVIVYLDNILIYSDGLPEHITHIQEVLQRLRVNGLFARADKCEFHVMSCEYLGSMLSPEGLTMASNKVQIIQDWPEPRKVKDIQSFLGFANFYRRFIHEYSRIAVLLQFSPTGCQTPQSQSRLTPLTMRSQPYSLLRHLPASCTPLPSIPTHFMSRNATMMFMTKSYSQYLKLSPDGNIILRVPVHPLMSSLITGTSSIFP